MSEVQKIIYQRKFLGEKRKEPKNSDFETNSLDLGSKKERKNLPEAKNVPKTITPEKLCTKKISKSIIQELLPTPKTEESTPAKAIDLIETEELDEKNESEIKNHLYDISIIQLNKRFMEDKSLLTFDYSENIPEFTPPRRLILLGWLMQSTQLIKKKRETFHLAVALVDSYVSKVSSFKTIEFQLVGIVCLIIAEKFGETYVNKMGTYELPENGYNLSLLKEYEIKVLNTLDYNVNICTIYEWSKLLLLKWELFIEQIAPLQTLDEEEKEKFRLFYYFIIDTIVLDYNYKLKDFRSICICVLYLLDNFKLNSLDNKNSKSPLNLIKIENENDLPGDKYYDNFFKKFLRRNKSLNIENYQECLPYVQKFMDKPTMNYISEYLSTLSPEIIHEKTIYQCFVMKKAKKVADIYNINSDILKILEEDE